MAILQPFHGLRPAEAYAASIAALPYDVYNRAEAKKIVSLRISRRYGLAAITTNGVRCVPTA